MHVGPTSEKEIDDLVKKEQQKAYSTVATMVAMVVVYLALILLLAFCYSKLWADPVIDVKPLEAEAFAYPAFGCLEDKKRRDFVIISWHSQPVFTCFQWILTLISGRISSGSEVLRQDMHACALGFCCMPFRWADTMKAAGLMGFWSGVLVFLTVSHLRILAQECRFSSFPLHFKIV